MASSFIENKSWNNSPFIENLSKARWFDVSNINAQTGTTLTNVTVGNLKISGITLPTNHPLPIRCYFAIIDPTEGTILVDDQISSAFTLDDDMIINHGFPSGDGADALEGKTIIVSFGWTRFKEREFRYMYPTQYFEPDVSTDPLSLGPIDPAQVIDFLESGPFGVGTWRRRDKSAKYMDHTFSTPSDSEDFIENELARWSGDNWSDGIAPMDYAADGKNSLTDYRDYPNVSKHKPSIESAIAAQKFGAATGGSSYRLEDTTKDWYAGTWYGGGVGHITSGTATSGSTTSLSDTSIKIDEELGSFWQDDRFPGFIGPYVDFIVEVSIDGVWEKRPILSASCTISGVTITWTEPLSATANGQSWRIREPKYELSRWQQRTLSVGQIVVIDDVPTLQSASVKITYSDNDTLFFDPLDFEIVAGALYTISEYDIGSVYRRMGGEWVSTGNGEEDVVRTAVSSPVPFHSNLRENLPTVVKRYGPVMKGDYVFYKEFFDQLYRAINSLIWILVDHTWTADIPPATPGTTINEKSAFTPLAGTEAYPRYKNAIAWAGGGPGVDEVGNPITISPAPEANTPKAPSSRTHRERTNSTFGETLDRVSSNAKIDGIPPFMASSVKLLTWTEIGEETYAGRHPDNGEIVIAGPDTTEWDFNAMGDNVAFRNWYEWSALDPSTDITRYSANFNGLPIPDVVPYGPAPSGGGTYTVNAGYQVVDQKAILNWAVPSGMKYVP